MRDRPCLCGCSCNAASSSRSPSHPSVVSRARRRSMYNPVDSSDAEGHSNPVTFIDEEDYSQTDCDMTATLAVTDAAATPVPRDHARRTRNSSSGLGAFSMIIMLVLTLITCVSAQTTVAATPTFLSTNFNTTELASPTGVPGYQQMSSGAAGWNGVFSIGATAPVQCEVMNITFDPSHGVPPYTVMISIEDYWPVTVSLPATYDDISKDLWLYQWPVPIFNGPVTTPNIIVSVSDLNGNFANSSSIAQASVPSGGQSCSAYEGSSTFFFYTEHPASMCQDYEIFWNGSYAPPMTALFLPENAPPINVPAPAGATNNMTWQVAMTGGTRFMMTMSDSKQVGGNGGVSRLNIVALNEYFSNSCIEQARFGHRLFNPVSTASPATVFPDATSTLQSLTTSKGVVATVTVVETIKNGRYVHNGGGGISSVTFLIIMVVVFCTMGLLGVALGWFCFRRHQKRKHNIKAWDLPDNDPSAPFSANPNMPITPGGFARTTTRDASDHDGVRGSTIERSSVSGGIYDPVSLSRQPLTHAASTRASLRSWTSGAYDQLHLATGGLRTSHVGSPTAGDYALMNTASGGASIISPSDLQSSHNRTPTVGNMSNGSREAWSPTDSVPHALGIYTDDPLFPENAVVSRGGSSDGASMKSNRVGPGPTYRPDAASQAAYQDLLASTTSPTSGLDRAFPFSNGRGQMHGNNRGWAEVTDDPANIVRHADAGLLLDDNDNGDELINIGAGRLMELPPQYDTIHPGTNSQQRQLFFPQGTATVDSTRSQPHSQRTHQNMASVDIADAGNRPAEVHAADLVDENDDESAFWAH